MRDFGGSRGGRDVVVYLILGRGEAEAGWNEME